MEIDVGFFRFLPVKFVTNFHIETKLFLRKFMFHFNSFFNFIIQHQFPSDIHQ